MAQSSIWWLLAGGAVAIELLTGTFYLLMLAVAAFGAGAVAWMGQGFPLQALVAAGIAAAGCWAVHVWRARNATEQMAPVDAGQPASFESWVDEPSGLARVRYRGASWEAQFVPPPGTAGAGGLEPGALVYVKQSRGNLLEVSRSRPA